MFVCVLALLWAASVEAVDVNDAKKLFAEFKAKYDKNYSGSEEGTRFSIFIDNLHTINDRNKAELAVNGTMVHGITMFSDLTDTEFRSKYLISNYDNSKRVTSNGLLYEEDRTIRSAGLTKVDWRGILTTPVKDQGYCGSCWAFSATEQIESDSMRLLGTSYTLSPQQILSCDKSSFGCGGGYTSSAYNYVYNAGGIEQDSDYPYTSYIGIDRVGCIADYNKNVVTIESFSKIVTGEVGMASYMLSTGPLSVCVDASSWNSYTGGIMKICGNAVDHCVQAVGVDISGSDPYWLVRNSWNVLWGEAGYIRLAYGKNTCNIDSDATYTQVGLYK